MVVLLFCCCIVSVGSGELEKAFISGFVIDLLAYSLEYILLLKSLSVLGFPELNPYRWMTSPYYLTNLGIPAVLLYY